jgi:predicted porin
MKKSLVALAALASFGAAFAQSSVTLYGRIDASIGNTKVEAGGATLSDPGVAISSGAHTGSRWGLSGTEDLGGGLKANFTLEQGFNVDDGSASNAANQFHRQAFVGLSGGFGSVNVGRQYDLLDQFAGAYDPMGNGGFSAQAFAFTTGSAVAPGLSARGIGNYVSRQNNAVQYATPNLSGFQAKVFWAPGEDKAPGVNSAGNHYGLGLNYASGALSVGGMYKVNKAGNARAINNWLVGAAYDFGAAKLFGQYAGGENKNTAGAKDDGYQLGVSVPFGAFSLTASYAAEDQKAAGSKISESEAVSLMGQYNLSKRTYVYAAYRQGEVDPVGAAVNIKERKYGLGVVHMF